jgi:N-acetylneuraminic acid mutarotase
MPDFADPRGSRAFFESLEPRQLLAGQTPFYGVPYNVPLSIQAEQYDSGGSRISYRDTESANLGDVNYRMGGVDFMSDPNTPGNHFVCHTKPGEWLEYTINVKSSGYYRFETRAASGSDGGTFHIYIDGVDKTGTRRIGNTGGWDVFKTIAKNGVKLNAGQHTVRLQVTSANTSGQDVADFDWIRVKRSAPQEIAPNSIDWSTKADAPIEREEAVSFVHGGKLYSIGGYIDTPEFHATTRVDVYDPATDKWTRLHDAPTKVTHAGVALDGDTVWIIGGYIGDFPDVGGPDGTSQVWKYNTKTDIWTGGPNLPSARGGGGAGIVGRTLYFFGGANKGRTADMKDTWALDLDGGTTWVKRANMTNPRNHFGTITYNGNIYVFGGQHLLEELSTNQSEVDLYDPVHNTWKQLASIPQPYSHFTFATVRYDRYVMLVGGEDPHDVGQAKVYGYDLYWNKWYRMTDLPGARRAGVAGVIGDTLVFSGGYFHDLGQTKDTWTADLSDIWTT